MTTLPTGIVVPDGDKPWSLIADLRKMGLTGNRIPSVNSQSEAQAIVDALASTDYQATTDNPVYVRRADTGRLAVHDGSEWSDLTQGLYIDSGNNVFSVTAGNGTFNLPFNVTFASPPVVVVTDGGQGSAAEYYKAGSAATTTGIQLVARKNGAALTGNCRVMWIAVGILA
jgi:hypothetical protein